MLRILYASSTDTLLQDLVRSLGEPGDPAARRPVLLPSRPLVERVQRALALEYGVAMGCELLLPAAFLRRLEQSLDLPEQHASWSAEGLFWRVLELLPALGAAHPRLGRACTDLRSRAALAREIADRLDQYLHFRPDLIHAWDQGLPLNEYLGKHPELKAVFKEGLPESTRADEAWQMDLWSRLRSALGHAHPAKRLDELARRAGQGLAADFSAGVEVLSTGPLPFPILKMLKALGENAEVRLRVLLPAGGYLADIQPRWRQWTQGLEADLDAEANPLLAQMGRQAVEFFQGLAQLSPDGQEFEPLEEGLEEGDSLLKRLRSDVRALRQPDPALRPVAEGAPGDAAVTLRSLRVHRCHSARREVEVLRDEILRAFKDLDGLRPEDVLILAPDLDLYGPLAESVLAGGPEPRLPLGLAERGGMDDALLKALLALLALASGRGSLGEALDFLGLPAVQATLGADQAASLAQALDAAGLSFGFDLGHRRTLEAGEDPAGTWRFCLDRLLAGRWLGQEASARDHEGKPALALAGTLGEEDLAPALDWCETLLETLTLWQSAASASDWAIRLNQALDHLLRFEETRLDPERCHDLTKALSAAEESHGCLTKLDAAAILDYARAGGLDEERRVSLVGGRVALGGLKPLRALPCRVLAIVGLSDTAFPRRSAARAWDLLAALPLPGDRDPRKDDRQLFLDSLLAAGERVILTAPVLSPRSDKKEPLSVCVEELLRAALDTLGGDSAAREAWMKTLVLDEPSRAEAARAFDGTDGRDRSFNAPALDVARRLAGTRTERPFVAATSGNGANAKTGKPLSGGDSTEPESLEVLLAFLKDPARDYLRALGLSLPKADADQDHEEPVDRASGLRAWQLGARAMDAALNQDTDFVLERFAAERLLPPARLGRLRGQAALTRAESLAQALRRWAPGKPKAFPCETAVSSGSRLAGQLPRATQKSPLILVSDWDFDLGKERWSVDGRFLLRAWLTACLAGAAGQGGSLFAAGHNKKDGKAVVLSLETPAAPQAQAVLKTLLDLRQEGRQKRLALARRTSHALALALLDRKDLENAASKAWHGNDFQEGDASEAGNALVWRGCEPFAASFWDEWLRLAQAVWGPPLAWWQSAQDLEADALARSRA